jgi:hypothetical protein
MRFERLVWMLAVPWPLLGACADFYLMDMHRLMVERASTVEPGAGIAFELTRNQGAVLLTKHSTYREDIERELVFEDYIKKHYDSWVDFSRDQGHGRDIRPVLVTGVDLTREFATAAYSDNRARMECKFSAAVPAVASASASVWGSWRAEGLVHTNCGPHLVHPTQGDRELSEGSAIESAIPDKDNQCIFIRYYTIRRRLFIPTVIKAGAGPHQLPKPHPPSDGDSIQVDYAEIGSHPNALDEVIHNVPSVCPNVTDAYPCLRAGPRMSVMALILLQNSYSRCEMTSYVWWCKVTNVLQQRSEAKSVLLHHRDIQDHLQVCLCIHLNHSLTLAQEDEKETIQVLTHKYGAAKCIEIDENGCKSLMVLA